MIYITGHQKDAEKARDMILAIQNELVSEYLMFRILVALDADALL